tara:strand:- start:114 stop:527 length:414 start_codon:yes stop_codon:yes gene_type:complete
MKDKYYTPEIEEFHVGFEFESNYTLFSRDREWVKCKLDENNTWFTEEWYVDAVPTEFRVKYLDKEDIESLGWEFHQQNHSGCLSSFWNKKDVLLRLTVSYKNSIPYVSIYHYEGWETPEMIIKNKSELKRILKQLSV